MDPKAVAALACLISALPLVYLGLSFRNGRHLTAIAGFHPERIRDHIAFGRFVGFWIMVVAILLMGLAASIAWAPQDWMLWATLGFTALLQVPVLRIVTGMSRYVRK